MAFEKCPRCELNYILDGGALCTVCRKEVHGGSEQDDIAELCTECGENPVVPGGELCLTCLKEMARRLSPAATEDDLVPDATLEIDSVSTMDEIVIDIDGEELPEDAFEDDEDADEDEDDEFTAADPLDDEEISLDALADDEDDDDLRDR